MTDKDASNLFSSTEEYYAEFRPDYPDETIEYLVRRFDLDESARVLDLGCGAGQIAVPLAEHVGEVVGMDPNEKMLRQARERAATAGRENVEWVVGSDADLREEGSPAVEEAGPFQLTTMGRSFHWMDQERTLETLHAMTEPGGGVAIVTDEEWLTRGSQDWQDDVYAVAEEYLDDLPDRIPASEVEYDDPWDEKLAAFGFEDVAIETFGFEREWDVDSVVGYVLSLSFCSPAVLGDDAGAFEADLRARLGERDEGTFVQRGEAEVIAGRKTGDS